MGTSGEGQAGFLGSSLVCVDTLAASSSSGLPPLADRNVRMGWDVGADCLDLADLLPLPVFSEVAGVAGLDL